MLHFLAPLSLVFSAFSIFNLVPPLSLTVAHTSNTQVQPATRTLGLVGAPVPLPAPQPVLVTASDCLGQASHIFPIIPDCLYFGGVLEPTHWNLDVLRFFAYKIAAFFQWLAMALSITLTIFAGLLYILGFAGESNIKKAKTVLGSCYGGLVIFILARIILFGSIQGLISSNYNPYEPPVFPTASER